MNCVGSEFPTLQGMPSGIANLLDIIDPPRPFVISREALIEKTQFHPLCFYLSKITYRLFLNGTKKGIIQRLCFYGRNARARTIQNNLVGKNPAGGEKKIGTFCKKNSWF